MRLFKRRYRSKNQQIALAGFTFGIVFVGIVMMIVLSAQTPSTYKSSNIDAYQNVLMSEAIIRYSAH